MALHKGLAANAVLSGIDEWFFSMFEQDPAPDMADVDDPYVFEQKKSNKSGEQTELFKDAGMWTQRAELEDLTEGEARSGYNRTFTNVSFDQVLPISKHYLDDEQYGTVEEAVRKMGLKGYLTKRREGFGLYRNAFTTTTTNEGSALISNTHTNLNSDTVDNYITAALDEVSLNTQINNLLEQVDQAGDNVGFVPHCLLVPNQLYKRAVEITESELRSDTANNDLNVYSSKYGLVVKQSNWIGAVNGGSNTAWFLLAKYHPVKRWVRQDIVTDLVDYKYADNFVYKYKAEYREVYGAPTYEGIVGSDGTT